MFKDLTLGLEIEWYSRFELMACFGNYRMDCALLRKRQDLGCMLKTLTVIVFSRSGYKALLGTPKRLLLRLSGNIMIVSGRCKRGYCGDTYETFVKLT